MHWYQIGRLWWPCKSTARDAEVTSIKIYDDMATKLDVEWVKLKPFNKLSKIPKSRPAEWKRAYERAIAEFES